MTWFDASFGSSKTGLATIGVEEYDITGAVTVARTTTGVVELEGGGYGRDWILNASTVSLVWDTGEATPIYAIEDTRVVKLNEVYTRLGLEKGNTITDTTTGIDSSSGDIDINRTGDGITTSTLARQ